ncbi:tetratricopeptide repeat protein [Streptomyces sp. NPDC047315]|uniref:tetratricopeptide repeat protein n=1 Tax=Streptomyces sp. NPDC047315 TaxID=3155142 RepID=UPI0033F8A877
MHDLLRVHAQEQARTTMDTGRASRRRYEQARTRLTDHYVRHAQAADTHLHPPGRSVSTLFTGREQALAWFDAERENLLATTHTHAHTQIALDLGFALGRYLDWRRHFQDQVTVRAHALAACQALSDTLNQAGAWNNLGNALGNLKRHAEALDAHRTALQLHQESGDVHGQAVAWNNIGAASRGLERYAEAIAAGEKAVAMLTQDEDWARAGEAWGELATTLDASGAEPSRVRGAWEQSAAAYTRAGEDEAAATSRANAEDPPGT